MSRYLHTTVDATVIFSCRALIDRERDKISLASTNLLLHRAGIERETGHAQDRERHKTCIHNVTLGGIERKKTRHA
jgi:hypothetical protein